KCASNKYISEVWDEPVDQKLFGGSCCFVIEYLGIRNARVFTTLSERPSSQSQLQWMRYLPHERGRRGRSQRVRPGIRARRNDDHDDVAGAVSRPLRVPRFEGQ